MNDRFLISLGDDFLVKAEEDENGDKFLYLHASSEAKDSQNETILQKALQNSKDYFLREGVISYDHLYKSVDKDGRVKINPAYVIGEPVEVKFCEDDKKNTFVKAKMYLDAPNDKEKENFAAEAFRLAKSKSSRLRASVGGRILERDKNDPNIITRVIWDDLAITLKPVNKALNGVSVIPLEEFAKSFNFQKIDKAVAEDAEFEKAKEFGYDLNDKYDRVGWQELKKAMEATSAQTDTAYTGGRALVTGGTKGNRQGMMKELATNIVNGTIKSAKQVDDFFTSKGFEIDEDTKKQIYQKIAAFIKRLAKTRKTK